MRHVPCTLTMLFVMMAANAQTGYIYVHTKTVSEDLNQSFSFSVSGGSSSVPDFTLKDQPLNIEPTDIGAGNGSGSGELWVVAGVTQGANGNIYHRRAGSTVWNLVPGQTASAIDGADLGHFVMVNTTGDAYVYNGSSFIQIFNHSNYGVKAVDIANNGSIACGNGYSVIVDANGHVWKYTGNYSSSSTWTDITPADNSGMAFKRIDINPSTNEIILYDAGGYVTKINSAGSGLVYYGRTGTAPSQSGDVTIDGNGNVYAVLKDAQGTDAAFRYSGSAWVEEPQSAFHYFLTSSAAGQIWIIKGYTAAQSTTFANPSTIYTRVGDGSGTWLDDERVQTTQNDNAIIIPVAPGIYNITESEAANWDLQNIKVYDSASGSIASVAGRNASVIVKAGQMVHVMFINEMLSPTVMPIGCGVNSIIQDFGSGATNSRGAALSGLTGYHYYNNLSSNSTPAGYYSLTQNSQQWPNNSLTSHSGIAGGYFLMVNASYAPGIFYRQRITGLISGSSYVLTFWAANLSPNLPTQQNVQASITDISSGTVLGTVNTQALPTDNAWHEYSLYFTATGSSSDFFLQNNAPGVLGNGFAVDDIGLSQACPVLPQTLVGFSALKQADKSIVSWATTSNLNFDHFEIERSADGQTWTTIAIVAAINNSSTNGDNSAEIKYSYSDNIPLNGLNFYKVKAVSSNGVWLYSDVKELQFGNNRQWKLSMYPNPAVSVGLVNIQSNEPIQMIRIFDFNGRMVFVKNISAGDSEQNTSYSLNTSSFTTGMYMVQIANISGATNSLKLIKKNQ